MISAGNMKMLLKEFQHGHGLSKTVVIIGLFSFINSSLLCGQGKGLTRNKQETGGKDLEANNSLSTETTSQKNQN
jgi:hypothetical protein